MDIKVLLNHVTKFKGFVFGKTSLDREANKLVVEVVPRKNSRPVCSRCGKPGSTYDHLEPREYMLPPIWGLMVVLLYGARRVSCVHCKKVRVEALPWSTGKSPVTKQLACFFSRVGQTLFLGGGSRHISCFVEYGSHSGDMGSQLGVSPP